MVVSVPVPSRCASKYSSLAYVTTRLAPRKRRFRHLPGQRYPDVENIVIDGMSTDGTLEVVAKHRRKIATQFSESDRGMYDTMNKAIALVTGDVIGLLNADDGYVDDVVREQVATVMAQRDLDAYSGDLVYDDQENPNRVVRYWKSQPYEDGLFVHD